MLNVNISKSVMLTNKIYEIILFGHVLDLALKTNVVFLDEQEY